MKHRNKIITLLAIALLFSCSNIEDNTYKKLTSEMDNYKLNSKYETPLINYFTMADSLSSILISENGNKELGTYNAYRSLIIINSVNDSVQKVIKDCLNFDYKTIDKKDLNDKIKLSRNIYAQSLVNYLRKMEYDNLFNDIIQHTYFTSFDDTTYLNLDIFIPTAKESSITVILGNKCQWANTGTRGLTLRVPDKHGVDTIAVQIEWFDHKLKNSVDKNIMVLTE